MPTAGNVTVNAPVMMNDATVGSIGSLRVKNWQARRHCACVRASKVPAGSYARVGYTSDARLDAWRSCRPNTSAAATCGR